MMACAPRPAAAMRPATSTTTTRRTPGRHLSPLCSDTLVLGMMCLLFISAVRSASALRITEMDVPTHADVRGAATLVCHYDMQNETLLSVKWYKGEAEFYRYLPGNRPPKTFPALGVSLDLDKSSDTKVTLRPLSYNTSGLYRCEVSADAPKFSVDIKEKNMTVIALPKRAPTIHVEQKHYSPGDRVRGNCTADKSNPPATLQWFVNGNEAQRWEMSHHDERAADNPLGLLASKLGLSFKAEQSHFQQGQIVLRCKASIAGAPSLTLEQTFVVEQYSNQKQAHLSSTGDAKVPTSASVLASLLLLCWRCL